MVLIRSFGRFCPITLEYQRVLHKLRCSYRRVHTGDNEAHRPSALQTEEVPSDEIRRLEKLRDQGGITEERISRAKKGFNRYSNCEPKQKKDLTAGPHQQ